MKSKEVTLVNFRAGWDFKPLGNKDNKNFTNFIFIDALPNKAHYEPGQAGYPESKDRETFINTLKDNAGTYDLNVVSNVNNHLTFKKKVRLDYYINTRVEDTLKDKAIQSKINQAKWVPVKGFSPSL